MTLHGRILHSVSDCGKIILTKEAMDEAGLIPGMPVEIAVKKGLITIRPLHHSNRSITFHWRDCALDLTARYQPVHLARDQGGKFYRRQMDV